jgi:RNA polymerase sigma-70 factor (ECF subfamily)
MVTLTDDELVRRCKAELPRETRSYELLVQRHMHRTYTMVYRLVGDREEAEDITQDIFVKVYNGLRKFDQQASFSTWLYRITINTAFDALDKMKRQRKTVETPIEDARIEPTSTIGPEDSAIRRELRECINTVLARLDRDYARALFLRDFEGMSYDEIATHLRLGLSAVKMRIHRARLTFQELFSQICLGQLQRTASSNGNSHKTRARGAQ